MEVVPQKRLAARQRLEEIDDRDRRKKECMGRQPVGPAGWAGSVVQQGPAVMARFVRAERVGTTLRLARPCRPGSVRSTRRSSPGPVAGSTLPSWLGSVDAALFARPGAWLDPAVLARSGQGPARSSAPVGRLHPGVCMVERAEVQRRFERLRSG